MNDLNINEYIYAIDSAIDTILNKYKTDYENHGLIKDDRNHYSQLIVIRNILNLIN